MGSLPSPENQSLPGGHGWLQLFGKSQTSKTAPVQTSPGWGAWTFPRVSLDQPFTSTRVPSLGCLPAGQGKSSSTQHAQCCRRREPAAEDQLSATPADNHKHHNFKSSCKPILQTLTELCQLDQALPCYPSCLQYM